MSRRLAVTIVGDRGPYIFFREAGILFDNFLNGETILSKPLDGGNGQSRACND